jgi:hypothetical protein
MSKSVAAGDSDATVGFPARAAESARASDDRSK